MGTLNQIFVPDHVRAKDYDSAGGFYNPVKAH